LDVSMTPNVVMGLDMEEDIDVGKDLGIGKISINDKCLSVGEGDEEEVTKTGMGMVGL
ncbi:hypothetical protein KI387_027115, partial [Taxus chinensis]